MDHKLYNVLNSHLKCPPPEVVSSVPFHGPVSCLKRSRNVRRLYVITHGCYHGHRAVTTDVS